MYTIEKKSTGSQSANAIVSTALDSMAGNYSVTSEL